MLGVVLEHLHSKVQACVEAGDWDHVKLYLRVVAVLGTAMEGNGLHQLLRVLISKAVDESRKPSCDTQIVQELYTCVLLTLPYYIVGHKSYEDTLGACSEILKLSRDVKLPPTDAKNHHFYTRPNITNETNEDDSLPGTSNTFVGNLKIALDNLESEHWLVSNFIDVPALIDSVPEKEKPLGEGTLQKGRFPAVNVPETLVVSDRLRQSSPYSNGAVRGFLQIYVPASSDEPPVVPSSESIEGVVMRDILYDLVSKLNFNRREVARQAITLDLFFAPKAFAPPGIPFDQLETLAEGQSRWKVEAVAVEAILDELFRLPRPAWKDVYYHSILIEACIMAPQAVAPVFGRAVRYLYRNLTQLDTELARRFVSWFSHHLSNFAFTWKWGEWKNELELPDFHPQKAFMQQLIRSEIRLSYLPRVKETLPPDFLALCPENIIDEPAFIYGDSDHKYAEVAQKLSQALMAENSSAGDKATRGDKSSKDGVNAAAENEAKADPADQDEAGFPKVFEEARNTILEAHVGGNADNAELDYIKLIFTTVCHLGARSPSHVQAMIENTQTVLAKVVSGNHELQKHAVASVLEFWETQRHVSFLIFDYLIRNKILSRWAVVDCLLDQSPFLLIIEGGAEHVLDLIKNDQDKSNQSHIATKVSRSLTIKASETTDSWLKWWYLSYDKVLRRHHEIN